jgi:hypothetical protein
MNEATREWILRKEEESKKGGNWLKMEPNDDKTIIIQTDPIEGINEYQGQKRAEFTLSVKDSKTGEEFKWAIRQKEVMQQILAIMKSNGMSSLVGSTFDISTRGPDSKTKHWFLRLANNGTKTQAQATSQDFVETIQVQVPPKAKAGAK